MSEFNYNQYVYTGEAESLRGYISKVFVNMSIGLFITAAVAFLGYLSVYSGGLMYQILASFPQAVFIFVIAELGIALAMGMGLTKFSTTTCRILFFVYSALTGLTFSSLFLVYTGATIFGAFAFTSVMFICCAIIGHTTNVDLTKFSGLLFGALIALVVSTIISMFIPVLRESLFLTYIGIILFLVLTAFDMQRIKAYYYNVGAGTIKENLAIYGAFQLYLDFINLFLKVLRILGSRSSRN